MADLAASQLDERMVAARNTAFQSAYYAIGGVIVAAAFAGTFAADGVTLSRGVLITGAFTVIMLISHLPTAILGWTERTI